MTTQIVFEEYRQLNIKVGLWIRRRSVSGYLATIRPVSAAYNNFPALAQEAFDTIEEAENWITGEGWNTVSKMAL